MKKPLLSVCIATFNQPSVVQRALQEMTKDLPGDVEIVVCDDSEGNQTEKIVKQYTDHKLVRYLRGPRQGLDGAVITLVEESRGEYVWWFGDEVLLEGAIQTLVSFLQEHPDATFVFINSRESGEKAPAFYLGGDKQFSSGSEMLETFADLLGFISATVFKRSSALTGLDASRRWIGSAFVNLYIVLHVLSQPGKHYFIQRPLFESEPKDPLKPLWYNPFDVFAVNLNRIVSSFRGRFSRRSIRKMLSLNFSSIWRTILVHRARGYTQTAFGSNKPMVYPLIRNYWSFPVLWLVLLLLVLPRTVVRIFYRFYKYFVPTTRVRLGLYRK